MSALPPSLLDHSTITVVDIDETQLRNNTYAHVKVRGNIETHSFPPNSFDLIVCHDVIEHLDYVDQAITQFHNALAPEGLLFIGAPNPESFSGFVTRVTPHWFHVWFYRVILKREHAGLPGHAPFPTVYHPLVSPRALLTFCENINFNLIYSNKYTSVGYTRVRERRPILGWLLYVTTGLINTLFLGQRDVRLGNYHVIFEKRGAP